ncbi:MAG TPA: glycosyltransferase family 4 protein [Chloroflexaceae bacterium]|nr:glycosyltransferase family 4 protein [Chloroflexaceae bacterium]
MRILMLDNEFPPLGGGMGTVNQALFRAYAGRPDLEIDLVTAALGARLEMELFAPNIRLYKVPVLNRNLHHSSNRELLMYAAQALPLARNLHRGRPYDRCLAWSALPAGAVALALRRAQGLPYAVWVSGPDIPGFERRYRALYPLLTPTIRATWRGAETVIAKCDQEVAMIRAVDPVVEPAIIPNGVDLGHFRPGPPIPDDGPLRVICVARLIERKGQHHLIEAVRRLAGEGVAVELELVGTGDAEAALRRQAREAGVAERVAFAGYVPRERIGERFRAAHVFALPSFNEGLALAALEALASGMPLVLSRTGGTGDLVADGVNGLTHAWADVDALAAHLRLLAADRALARRMAGASRGRADRFGWEAIAAQFEEVLGLGAPRISGVQSS